jgi:hypothetical protein
MTELLTKAFEAVSKLPQEMQDEVAQRILADLAGEVRWDNALARSQNLLERLAEGALDDLRSGRTREMGIDEL